MWIKHRSVKITFFENILRFCGRNQSSQALFLDLRLIITFAFELDFLKKNCKIESILLFLQKYLLQRLLTL